MVGVRFDQNVVYFINNELGRNVWLNWECFSLFVVCV